MWMMLPCHRMPCVFVVNTNLNSSCDLSLNKIRTLYIDRCIYKYITGFILYNWERVESASPLFLWSEVDCIASLSEYLSLNRIRTFELGMCGECPPHSHSTDGTVSCACEAGYTGLGTRTAPCVHCPAGTFKNSTGSSACVDCAADTFSQATGATTATTCVPCGDGSGCGHGSSSGSGSGSGVNTFAGSGATWGNVVGYGVATISRLHKMVSFAEYSLFCKALLQKRPIILRSLLIVATP